MVRPSPQSLVSCHVRPSRRSHHRVAHRSTEPPCCYCNPWFCQSAGYELAQTWGDVLPESSRAFQPVPAKAGCRPGASSSSGPSLRGLVSEGRAWRVRFLARRRMIAFHQSHRPTGAEASLRRQQLWGGIHYVRLIADRPALLVKREAGGARVFAACTSDPRISRYALPGTAKDMIPKQRRRTVFQQQGCGRIFTNEGLAAVLPRLGG